MLKLIRKSSILENLYIYDHEEKHDAIKPKHRIVNSYLNLKMIKI